MLVFLGSLIVITYERAEGPLQGRADLRGWEFAPVLEDALFVFTPDADAERIVFRAGVVPIPGLPANGWGDATVKGRRKAHGLALIAFLSLLLAAGPAFARGGGGGRSGGSMSRGGGGGGFSRRVGDLHRRYHWQEAA